MAYTKIAVAGANGNIGEAVLAELIAANKFDIIVLTREGSSSKFPSGVKVKPVDYSSLDSLTSALQGVEAVVSTLGAPALGLQPTLVDAAVAAGVKRFIPSEYGSDTNNEKTRALPLFAAKIKTEEHLKSLTDKISYTTVITGVFLDWGINQKFTIDVVGKKINLYDGGKSVFSTTSLSAIGRSVVGILTHPEETKNRAVYIAEKQLTQLELVDLAKSVVGEDGWEINQVNSDDALKNGQELLAKGDLGPATWAGFLAKAIYASEYGAKFQKLDNELFGIKTISDDEIREIIRQAAKN